METLSYCQLMERCLIAEARVKQLAAIVELKAGYQLGHADVAILQGVVSALEAKSAEVAALNGALNTASLRLADAEDRIASLEARTEQQPVVTCWSCKNDVEVEAIGHCDGYCPNCNQPIDLDDEPYTAPPAPAPVTVMQNAMRSFITDDDIAALNRFADCIDDPDSGGHDLEKEQVARLEKIGALQRSGRISYITDFGDLVISVYAGIKIAEGE